MERKLERKIICGAGKAAGAATGFFRRYWRRILYYFGVALVLCAVAYAAEQYRSDAAREEMVLPAADITVPAGEESSIELWFPEGMRSARDFSDAPFWNNSLVQWECHQARDYILTDDAVYALAEGEICGLGCDARTGNYIEIAGGDYILRYASATAAEDLKLGDKVKRGDRIGTADDSMLSERYMPRHLHLEMLEHGRRTDPEIYRKLDENAAES